jgi:hypothetical protein
MAEAARDANHPWDCDGQTNQEARGKDEMRSKFFDAVKSAWDTLINQSTAIISLNDFSSKRDRRSVEAAVLSKLAIGTIQGYQYNLKAPRAAKEFSDWYRIRRAKIKHRIAENKKNFKERRRAAWHKHCEKQRKKLGLTKRQFEKLRWQKRKQRIIRKRRGLCE